MSNYEAVTQIACFFSLFQRPNSEASKSRPADLILPNGTFE